MKCCGKEMTTPYCPSCGKGSSEPLVTLLAHVRKNATGHRKRVDGWLARNPDSHRSEKVRRIAEKWEAWRDALIEVIQKEQQCPTVNSRI